MLSSIKKKRTPNFRLGLISAALAVLVIGCAPEEGDDSITTLPRDKFIGTWNVQSNGTLSGPLTWDLIIEPASASTPQEVVMRNFDLSGNNSTITAIVSGSNLSIPSDILNGATVEGSGYLSGATLYLDYTSTDSQTDSVHATATK